MEMRLSTRALTEFNKHCVWFIFIQPTPMHLALDLIPQTLLGQRLFLLLGHSDSLVTKMLPFSLLNLGCVFRVLFAEDSKSLSHSRAQLPHCNSPSSCPTPEYKLIQVPFQMLLPKMP